MTLPRVSDTHISVVGGGSVTGIPWTRRDSTAPRTDKMERTSRSRFSRACRTWHVGARRESGVVPPDGHERYYRVPVGRGDRNDVCCVY